MKKLLTLFLLTIFLTAFGTTISVVEKDLSKLPKIRVIVEVEGIPVLNEKIIRIREFSVTGARDLSFILKRNLKVHIALLVDVSGSMKKYFSPLKNNVKAFLRELPEGFFVKLLIFGYSKDGGMKFFPKEGELEADDVHKLSNQLDALKPHGATPLYDAILKAYGYLKEKEGRKVIAIISDGRDENFSGNGPGSSHTLKDLDKLGSDVAIFAVGLGNVSEAFRRWILSKNGRFYENSIEGMLTDLLSMIRRPYEISFIAGSGDRAEISIKLPGGIHRIRVIYPKEEILVPAKENGYLIYRPKRNFYRIVHTPYPVEDILKLEKDLYMASGYYGAYKNGKKLPVIGYVKNVIFSGGKILFGVEGKGVFDENGNRLFGCDLINLKRVLNESYAVCKRGIYHLSSFRKISETANGVGELTGKLAIFDSNGITIKGNRVVKEAGIADVNGAYINSMSHEIVYGNKRKKTLSIPTRILKKGDRFFVIDWLGGIEVYDLHLKLLKYFPPKTSGKLISINPTAVLKSLELFVETSQGFTRLLINFPVYDALFENEKVFLALGENGLGIYDKNGLVLKRFLPVWKIVEWNGNIAIFDGEDLIILDPNDLHFKADIKNVKRAVLKGREWVWNGEEIVTPNGRSSVSKASAVSLGKLGIAKAIFEKVFYGNAKYELPFVVKKITPCGSGLLALCENNFLYYLRNDKITKVDEASDILGCYYLQIKSGSFKVKKLGGVGN